VRHYFILRPDAACIEAKVDAKNTPSIRVLQKCGFDEIETLVGGAELAWMDPPVRDLVVFRAMRK
jgi:RimJ/RimL family protein N-acetyltransferase